MRSCASHDDTGDTDGTDGTDGTEYVDASDGTDGIGCDLRRHDMPAMTT
ncbi:MAG: hypothetical protein R3F65_19380 [bacterium]